VLRKGCGFQIISQPFAIARPPGKETHCQRVAGFAVRLGRVPSLVSGRSWRIEGTGKFSAPRRALSSCTRRRHFLLNDGCASTTAMNLVRAQSLFHAKSGVRRPNVLTRASLLAGIDMREASLPILDAYRHDDFTLWSRSCRSELPSNPSITRR
jgi:hypothetical protein